MLLQRVRSKFVQNLTNVGRGFLCATLLTALASSSSFAVGSDSVRLDITMGKAEVITLPQSVSDIMVADPKIADVSALQNDKLYVVGASLGNTNVIIMDGNGEVLRSLDVHVSVDTTALQNIIRDIFPHEKNVLVRTLGSQVALTGRVSTPAVAQKIAKLVAAHLGEVRKSSSANTDSMIENMLEVQGEQQVTLRVRILEVSRDVLKELGIETSVNNPNATGTNVFGRSPSSSVSDVTGAVGVNTQTGLTKDPFGITSLLFDTGIGGIGDIQFLLNALESDNLANVLAEPNLTAVSGEQAGFLAGGEFPVPIGRDRDGNIVIEYKQFGVSLNFKPVVMSEDRISLQLNTEVSSLDQGKGITLSDIQIPGLDVRRASTTVEINSGGSLMLAGLMKSENTKGLSGIPGIKDTPVLGDLISSKSFLREETELVVLVTPYLVQPFADKTQAKGMFQRMGTNIPVPAPSMVVGDKGKATPLYSEEQAQEMAISESELDTPPIATAPMTQVFTRNMKKIYGDRMRNLPENQAFGYMID